MVILLPEGLGEAGPSKDVVAPEQGYQRAQGEEGAEGDGVLAPLYFEQEQHRRHQPAADDAEEQCQQYQGEAGSQPNEGCQLDIAPAHPARDDRWYEQEEEGDGAADGGAFEVRKPTGAEEMRYQCYSEGDGYRRIDYPVRQYPMLQVGDGEDDQDAAVGHHHRQVVAEAVFPEEEGEEDCRAYLHPEYALGNGCTAVAAAAP